MEFALLTQAMDAAQSQRPSLTLLTARLSTHSSSRTCLKTEEWRSQQEPPALFFGTYSGTTWWQQPWSGRHWMVVCILVQVSPIVLATVKQALYASSSQLELNFPVSPFSPESEHPWSKEPRLAKKEIAANLPNAALSMQGIFFALRTLGFPDRPDRPRRAKAYKCPFWSYAWNSKQPFFLWLFQLDDSKSLHKKMVLSPNIHEKMVVWGTRWSCLHVLTMPQS